ncbi:MAG TPA: YpmS family protein [Bacillales bacterium]|nr:YpmS family protein [Bacillales bacterium]
MAKAWKFAFFSLLLVFIACIVALVALFHHYLPPAHQSDLSIDSKLTPGQPIFTVSTTKEQLQPMINRKIKRSNKMESIHYRLLFSDQDMILDGSILLLGSNIEFQMKFKPKTVDHGNLILEEQSARLGLFNLPVDRVLEYVKKSADLPKWVQILPKKKSIYIALKKIRVGGQFYLRAKKIDLKKDQLQFAVYTLK